MARLLGAVPSGSYLTISHAASDMVLERSLTVAKTS